MIPRYVYNVTQTGTNNKFFYSCIYLIQAMSVIFCLVSLLLFLCYSITKENFYKNTPYLHDNIYQINGLLILLLHFYLNITIYRHTN